MIDDWRYDDGKMTERQICLTAFIHQGIPINREVYEFCHYYVSNGMLKIPDTKEKLEEELRSHNGDLYAFVGDGISKEFSTVSLLPFPISMRDDLELVRFLIKESLSTVN